MSALYLTETDVAKLIDMPAVIGVVEEALKHLADVPDANVPRQRAKGSGIILHTMSAAADYLGFTGWKAYTTTKRGARFLVGLYGNATGELVALLEADRLGQLRTGATTGVAVKHLARADADSMGLFGTGTQARTQLSAVAAVRPIKQALVYGRDEARRRRFCDEMEDELGIDVVPAGSPEEAVRGMPIVVTATTSREPVFAGADLAPGALVCAVGSNWLNKAEIDVITIAHAARVVCDDVAACRNEAGDLVPAVTEGKFNWSAAVGLPEILAGRKVGRKSNDEIIVFKSVGLAIEDVALAVELVQRAKAAHFGRSLPLG
jgi:alanine dehydrogenase